MNYLARFTPLQIAAHEAHLARRARMQPPPPPPPILGSPAHEIETLEMEIIALKAKVRSLMAQLSAAKSQPINKIQDICAAYYGVAVTDILSIRRAREAVTPRHVAMWLCRKLTTNSFPDIGAHFGGRDHTTVMHAVRKIERKRHVDPRFSAELDVLVETLESEPEYFEIDGA